MWSGLHAPLARVPVLFIVEDLHWVDASTLEFLGSNSIDEFLHDRILTFAHFPPPSSSHPGAPRATKPVWP